MWLILQSHHLLLRRSLLQLLRHLVAQEKSSWIEITSEVFCMSRVSYSSQPTCNLGPGDFLLASGSLTGKPEYSAGPGYVLLKWCVIIYKICLSSVLRTNINRFWFKCHPLFLWLISLNPLFPRLRLYIWRFCPIISFWNCYQFPATDFPWGQLSLSTANLFFHLQLLSEYEA